MAIRHQTDAEPTTPPVAPFRTRWTDTAAELSEAWTLGQAVYESLGLPYPPLERVLDWWRAYPRSPVRAVDGAGRVWGYCSIWPIRSDTYRRMAEGRFAEVELTAGAVAPPDEPHDCWYIADVCRARRPAGTTRAFSECLTATLARDGFRFVIDQPETRFPVKLVAFSYSIAGGRLLARWQFREGVSAADSAEDRVFTRVASATEMVELVKSLDADVAAAVGRLRG